jgi:hypothetical protein
VRSGCGKAEHLGVGGGVFKLFGAVMVTGEQVRTYHEHSTDRNFSLF